MSEREHEILETLAEALPKMDDMKKGELLGYGKAMVDIKKSEAKEAENEPDGDLQNTNQVEI